MKKILIMFSLMTVMAVQIGCQPKSPEVKKQEQAMKNGDENTVSPGTENPHESQNQ